MKIDTEQLSQWRSQGSSLGRGVSVDQWLWAARMATLALLVVACLSAVLSAARLFANSQGPALLSDDSAPERDVAQPAEVRLDASAVKSWGWFSEPQSQNIPVAPPLVVDEAELSVTKLKLRLEGIALSPVPEDSLAIIEINGKSERYQIGAKLPIATNVYLRAIKRNSVHLENRGKLEELPLFSDELYQRRKVDTGLVGQAASRLIDNSRDAQVVSALGRYREQIQRDPTSVGKLMRFSLEVDAGRPVGFKIAAAGNPAEFKRMGLRDGDVVTHVNGVPLTDYTQAMGLYQNLGNLTDLRLELQRQGQTQEILYRLPD